MITLLYRCIRCKKEFEGSKLPTDKKPDQVAEHMRALAAGYKPPMVDYHRCGGGDTFGMGEFMGFKA